MSEKKTCSFCNRGEGEVEFLIPSPDLSAYICPMCVDLCEQILDEYDYNEKAEKESASDLGLDIETLPTPKEIKSTLDDSFCLTYFCDKEYINSIALSVCWFFIKSDIFV